MVRISIRTVMRNVGPAWAPKDFCLQVGANLGTTAPAFPVTRG